MKKLILCSFLIFAAVMRAADSAPTTSQPAASPSAALDWLAGGTWTAALPPDQSGNAVKIELVVAKPQNQVGLRFHSDFLIGPRRAPYTAGMYAWDAAKKKFAIFYTDSSGSLSSGEVRAEDGAFVHEFTVTDKAGQVEQVRVRLTKIGTGAFTNEIFVLKDGAWAKIVSVRYERPE